MWFSRRFLKCPLRKTVKLLGFVSDLNHIDERLKKRNCKFMNSTTQHAHQGSQHRFNSLVAHHFDLM